MPSAKSVSGHDTRPGSRQPRLRPSATAWNGSPRLPQRRSSASFSSSNTATGASGATSGTQARAATTSPSHVHGFVTELVLAIFGPTGSGKSDVAQALVERMPAEVVSADSMQVYRGLPILTNQSPG